MEPESGNLFRELGRTPVRIDRPMNRLPAQLQPAAVGRHWPIFALAFAAVYGVRFSDIASALALASNFFVALPPDNQYLHASPLGPLLAWLLGLAGWPAITLYYLAWTVAATSAAVHALMRPWESAEERGAALILFSLAPLWLTLLTYLDSSSSQVLLFYALLLLEPGAAFAGLLAFLLVASHREQGSIILLLHLFLRRPPPARAIAIVFGAVLALAAVHLLLGQVVGLSGSRADTLAETLDRCIRFNLLQPVGFVLFALNWFLGVLALAGHHRLLDGRAWIVVVIALAVASVTTDTTRVTTLVGLPLLFWTVERVVASGLWRNFRYWPVLVALCFLQVDRAIWSDPAPVVTDSNWIPFLETLDELRREE